MRWTLWLALLAFSSGMLVAQRAPAQAPQPAAPGVMASSPESSFWDNQGRWTFGLQVAYGLENGIPRNISHIDLLYAQPAVGLILWNSPQSLLPLSRFEMIEEGILGGAVHPSARLLGHALIFRLDGKPKRRVVPFFDFGAGMVDTSLTDHGVPEVSGHLQFLDQGGPGIQYFFRPQCAFVIEYRYFHMSNAGITPPNHGFNGSMITIGFRWLRRPRGQ